MPNNFNALMDPAQIGQMVSGAIMAGAQTRALSNYAKNPGVQSATGVAELNPQLGIQLQDRERQRQAMEQKAQQEAQAAELRRRAAAGDPAAKAELAGIDFSAWNALDDNQRTEVKMRTDAIGQAALAVSQLPPQQQPQAWDAYVGQLAQRWPDLAQYQGKYSPEALQAAIAQAGMVKDALGLAEPKYMAIPPGGTLVNTRDPAAIAQFGAQQMQPQGAPQPGAIEDGYRFRGGNPADPNSWEPVMSDQQGGQALNQAYQQQVISPAEADRVRQSLGPNGQAAFAEWLRRNNIVIGGQ